MGVAFRRLSPLVALVVIWISLMSLAVPDDGANDAGILEEAVPAAAKGDQLLPDLISVSAAIASTADPAAAAALPPAVERVLSAHHEVLLVPERSDS